MFEKVDSKKINIEERLEFIEFRQQLLFSNSETDRLLFEYNITKNQYKEIMGLMDEYRTLIESDSGKNYHGIFEQRIYDIAEHLRGDYHFCEYITRAFKNEGRWEEVFINLYGDMPKYKGLNK